MADVNHRYMTLSPDKLNSLDRWILDFLKKHEWASPNVLRVFYNEGRDEENQISRQWVSSRVTRFVEHGHVEHIHPDTSTYRLVSDPRNVGGDTTKEPDDESETEETA